MSQHWTPEGAYYKNPNINRSSGSNSSGRKIFNNTRVNRRTVPEEGHFDRMLAANAHAATVASKNIHKNQGPRFSNNFKNSPNVSGNSFKISPNVSFKNSPNVSGNSFKSNPNVSTNSFKNSPNVSSNSFRTSPNVSINFKKSPSNNYRSSLNEINNYKGSPNVNNHFKSNPNTPKSNIAPRFSNYRGGGRGNYSGNVGVSRSYYSQSLVVCHEEYYPEATTTTRSHEESKKNPKIAPFDSKVRIINKDKADLMVAAMNSKYIRKYDTSFFAIIKKSPQCAVFFFHETTVWTEAQYIGCFFMYERTEYPEIGMIVLNRIRIPNWVYSFSAPSIEIMISGKCLLLKNDNDIFCLWFYEEGDSQIIGNMLKKSGAIDNPDTETDVGTYLESMRLAEEAALNVTSTSQQNYSLF